MSINGADLARMTDEEIRKLFPGQDCVECGNPIDEFDPHPGEGDSCSNCYFAALGEEVEAHPIGVPRGARYVSMPTVDSDELGEYIETHPICRPGRRGM